MTRCFTLSRCSLASLGVILVAGVLWFNLLLLYHTSWTGDEEVDVRQIQQGQIVTGDGEGKLTTSLGGDEDGGLNVTEENVVTQEPLPARINTENITKVLLVAYYRSGSTFLGQMLNQNPDVFYMFEPLKYHYDIWEEWAKKHGSAFLYYYPNGTKFTLPDNAEDRLLDIIQDIYACRLENLDPVILTFQFYTYLNTSNTFLQYRHCFRKAKAHHSAEDCVRECLPDLIAICKEKQIRVIKSIRLSADMVSKLLTRDSSIKVVHYTRDPRGIVVSQASLNGASGLKMLNWTKMLKSFSTGLCNGLASDVRGFRGLAETRGILRLRYEDLALDTDAQVGKLYGYLRTHLPAHVNHWIQVNTRAESRDGVFQTRRNSTQTATRWRQLLPLKSKHVMDRVCGQVLTMLNYTID